MEFIHRIASHAPVPAGGAAVANSFGLAVALVYKVLLFGAERNLHHPSINGTVHVARDNLRSIRVPEKRENYLKRLNELHKTYQHRYHKIIEKISAEPDELNPYSRYTQGGTVINDRIEPNRS